jgi:O-antigen ligase
MASVALLACIVVVIGLFVLERDKSSQTSKGLWLPVIWFWIIGSRPVSEWWFGVRSSQTISEQLDGSPTDRAFFVVLLIAGIVVLLRRRNRAGALLRANGPILIYFAYCLLSVVWSPFPDVAFKRWSKAIGDLVMAFVVVTDADPVAALRRLLSRTAFILLPFSVYLIRYSELGRGYTPDGEPMNTGITTNKNILGVVTLVLMLGAVWRIGTLIRDESQSGRRRHLLAQSAIVAIGIAVFLLANSATSLACFGLGSSLIIVTSSKTIRRRPASVHAVVLTLAIIGGLTVLMGGQSAAVGALGRDSTLTGRTDIWKAVIPAVPNAVLGAGFEGFWIAPSTRPQLARSLSQYLVGINEAHNGFIEVYLNLGWIGVGLIILVLISAYRRACAAFRHDPEIASLLLAYIVIAPLYCITEAGFRMLGAMWIFLLLAIVAATQVARPRVPSGAPEPLGLGARTGGGPVTADVFPPGRLSVGRDSPLSSARSAVLAPELSSRRIARASGKNR